MGTLSLDANLAANAELGRAAARPVDYRLLRNTLIHLKVPRRRLGAASRPQQGRKKRLRTNPERRRRAQPLRVRATVGGKLAGRTASGRGWSSHLSAVLALEPFLPELHFPSARCGGTSVPVEAEGTSGWAGPSRRAGAESCSPCGGGRRHRVAGHGITPPSRDVKKKVKVNIIY